MLNFFKRSAATAATSVTKAVPRSHPSKQNDRRSQSGPLPAPLPVPEVVEGNEDSDWALWEDSVSFQNSQLPGLASAVKSAQGAQTAASEQGGSPDAFDSVHKHAP